MERDVDSVFAGGDVGEVSQVVVDVVVGVLGDDEASNIAAAHHVVLHPSGVTGDLCADLTRTSRGLDFDQSTQACRGESKNPQWVGDPEANRKPTLVSRHQPFSLLSCAILWNRPLHDGERRGGGCPGRVRGEGTANGVLPFDDMGDCDYTDPAGRSYQLLHHLRQWNWDATL